MGGTCSKDSTRAASSSSDAPILINNEDSTQPVFELKNKQLNNSTGLMAMTLDPPMEMEELRRTWLDQQQTIKNQSIIIDSLKQELLELKGQRENQPNDLKMWSKIRRLQEEERVLPTITRFALANARKQILAPLVAKIEGTRDRINGIEEDSKC